MKIAKVRRDRLFKNGKPIIRPAIYSDIRWIWAAAKRSGFNGTAAEFNAQAEPQLADADRLFVLEDRNAEFERGSGPVALVAANYDGWSLVPHVEWFPWATLRNKLRCTVGYLQAMRYAQDVGSVKIFATGENAKWFKWLRRYLPIITVGRIPAGRPESDEWVFYLRGRKNDRKKTVRRSGDEIGRSRLNHSPTTASYTQH